MAKPFDATLNSMIDAGPAEWVQAFAELAGVSAGPSQIVDTDLATTVQSDKVFKIDGPSPMLLHLEFEVNPSLGIPRRLMRYNTLIDYKYDLPVETVLVLLRRKALSSDQTGVLRRRGITGRLVTEFHYHVAKVWEHPVDYWLARGITLAPLSLLTDEAEGDLESALSRFAKCLRQNHAHASMTKSLLGSSYVLCGLRYEQKRVTEAYRRLTMLMKESTTYQVIRKEGRNEGISQGRKEGISQGRKEGISQGHRNTILLLGTERFGAPSRTIAAALRKIDDIPRLERLAKRILVATNWKDLLADG